MKYIRLFESFNNHNITEFRVNLVHPGMNSGKYLFTHLDGGNCSWWGVFDIRGLKKMEDSINTKIIIDDIMSHIKRGSNNPRDWENEWRNINVTPVPDKDLYINLRYMENDSFSGVRPGFFTKDEEDRRDESGIGSEIERLKNASKNTLFGGIYADTSEDKQEENDEAYRDGEVWKSTPIEINTLWAADDYWQSPFIKNPSGGEYFVWQRGINNPAPPHRFPEGATLQEVNPYINHISDDIPDGILDALVDLGKRV